MASPKCVLSILMLFMYTPALGYNDKSETSVCSLVKPGHYTPYNTTWTMGCRGEGDSVSKIESHNHFTDRKWNFDCRPSNLTIEKCSLIETSQQSLQDIHYICKGGIISGFKTIYRPLFKDRVWMFYCCPVAETLNFCNKSGYVNRFNQDLSFNIPLGYYLHGVESFHDSTSNDSDQRINGTRFHQGYRSDRRWSYTICKPTVKKPRSSIPPLGCNNKSLSLVVDVKPGLYTPYNKTWSMACQTKGDSISKVQSHYHSQFMDRKWKFDCEPSNLKIKSCSMVITKQKMMHHILYRCKGGIITGFKSVFSFEMKDRVWIFYCCPVAGVLVDCENSNRAYDNEKDFTFDIPKGYHLHGVESYHPFLSPWKRYYYERDRYWSYTFCKVSDKETFPVIPTLVCEKPVASVGDIMPGQCTPYQKRWTMKCLNEGDSIGKLQSHYDTRLADRTWKFDCRPSNLNIKKCSMAWTGQEILFDLRYTCKGGIIAGFENKNYSPDYKDQSWIVYCCPIVETLVDCKNSGFVNKFYKDAYFDIPQGYYLHGVESVHDYKSHLEELHTSTTYQYESERRWRYTFCKVASKNVTGQSE